MENQEAKNEALIGGSGLNAGLAPTLSGFAIFASLKHGSRCDEPLGYALPNQPYEGLLLKRGYVCMFPTRKSAMDALETSLLREDAMGSDWHKKSRFTVMEVRSVGANVKLTGCADSEGVTKK
jgi:hypothetical protein